MGWTGLEARGLQPVTQGRVLAVLESLNTNKPTGFDGIPAKVLKIGAVKNYLNHHSV